MRPFGPALLAFLFLACPPSIDTGNDGGGVISVGPEGGIFIREGVGIDIPKNSVSQTTQITVMVLDSTIPDVPERKRISYGFRIFPTSLVFQQPVKIIIPYLDDRVPKGVDPGTFDMRRQGGSDAYLALPGSSTNSQLKVVEARTERLGLFWLTSPTQANVEKLTLTPSDVFLRVGDSQQFQARVSDAAGDELALDIEWSVVPSRVGEIDANGLFKANDAGTATITARAGSLTQTATARVAGKASGPQTFVHDNPFPTGNDLFGGTVFSGGAFFVGANATVLEKNAAHEWSRKASGPGIVLRAAAGPSRTQAVAVGSNGTAGVLVELSGTNTPKISTFGSVDPVAVWFDGHDGMAVGNGNDVILRRNGSWVREFSPSFETLLSVVGDGQGGYTTLGNRGSIYQFNPNTQTWISLFQSQLAVLLTQAVLANPEGTEAWAVGGNKLWHFQFPSWTAVNLPDSPVISEMTAMGLWDDQIVLGGRSGKSGQVFVYTPPPSAGTDGGVWNAWSQFSLRGPQIPRGIFGSSSIGYLVGDFGAVWQYTSGQWTELSSGFYGQVSDLEVTETAVLAAVNECVDANCQTRVGNVFVRQGPHQWTPLSVNSPFFGRPIYAISATGPSNMVAAVEGALLRFDGLNWSDIIISGGFPTALYDVRFCGNTLYAVGEGGVVFRGNQSTVNAIPSFTSNPLYSISCRSNSEVWIAGSSSLFVRKGTGSFRAANTEGVSQGDWRAVFTPAEDEAFAFGQGRSGVYWNTQSLSVIDAPGGILPNVLTSMWGSSVDNLYAVGQALLPSPFGYAVRFDGATWTLMDSGSQRKVTTISGNSSTNIWLGTEGGGLLQGVPP